MASLDKREAISHHDVFEKLFELHIFNSHPELNVMSSTIDESSSNYFIDIGIQKYCPSNYDPLDVKELYFIHEYVKTKYKEAHRKFKMSFNHDDFQMFVGNDEKLAPTLYYFYLQ